MRKIRILVCVAVVLVSVDSIAQSQATQQKANKRSGAGSGQSTTTSTGTTRGMVATPNAPQPDTPNSAAAAATVQATNPYYGTPTAANPQGGGACGSGGPADDLATCQRQMAWLRGQRMSLLMQQRGTQHRIDTLQASGNAANDGQVSQLQTRIDNLNQQISSLDARIATVRDRIAQLGGQTSAPTADKRR